MTENEAQDWLAEKGWLTGDVGERLRWLVAETLVEGDRQNLISAGTREMMWSRHIVDSAQLLSHAPSELSAHWVDIGTGAGFPGLVIACIAAGPIVLVEPRPLRVAHLERCIDQLGLAHCSVIRSSISDVHVDNVGVISARAYAPLEKIFNSSQHLSGLSTTWILPKGRNAHNELASTRVGWQGVFHVEQSVTDPESRIVVASGVERRNRPSRSAPRGNHGQQGRRTRA